MSNFARTQQNSWAKENDLILNPDESTGNLFYSRSGRIQQNTKPKNQQHSQSYSQKLNFAEHTRITKEKADKSLNVVKALTSTTWGKQKETLIATYKTITQPVIEYGNTLWLPIISDTNLNKLQTTQNTALRIITGCTADTNIQHLHTETQILPLSTHLKLHASQLRQKAQFPTHTLHSLTKQNPSRRQMKQTIFENTSFTTNVDTTPTNTTETTVQENIKEIHHSIAENHIQSLKPNKIINQPALPINKDEQTLLRKTRRTFAQLRQTNLLTSKASSTK